MPRSLGSILTFIFFLLWELFLWLRCFGTSDTSLLLLEPFLEFLELVHALQVITVELAVEVVHLLHAIIIRVVESLELL